MLCCIGWLFVKTNDVLRQRKNGGLEIKRLSALKIYTNSLFSFVFSRFQNIVGSPSKACERCNQMYVDPVDHFFKTCVKTQPQRERFWQSIQALPIQAEIKLNSLCDSEFSCAMLGAPLHSLNTTDNCVLLQIIANSWYLTDTDYFD